jgi:hypothetical protein
MYLALHRGGWAMQKQLGQLLLDQLLVIYEIQQDDDAHLLTLMENIEIDQWIWQMELWSWWLKGQGIGRFLLSILTSCFIGLAIEIALMLFKSSDGMHEQKRRITTLLERTVERFW